MTKNDSRKAIIGADLTSNTPPYLFALAEASLPFSEVEWHASEPRFLGDGFYRGSGVKDDLMKWVFRLSRSLPPVDRGIAWRLLRMVGYLTAWIHVVSISIRRQAKVVHLQWCIIPVFDALMFILLKAMGFRIVYTVHNPLPHDSTNRILRRLYRFLYRISDALIIHSSRIRADLLEVAGRDIDDRVHVIPIGIMKPREPVPDRKQARKYLNIQESDEVVLFFGAISPYKGVDDLIRGFATAVEKKPKLKLVIAGACTEPFERYAKEIESLGLENRVRAIPEFCTEELKSKLYAAADICVLPHRRPTQSGTGLEALGWGKPLIVTTGGGLPDLVVNGVTGYVIPAENPAALGRAIVSFFDRDERERGRMAEASARFGSDKFNWDSIAARHADLYREICSDLKGWVKGSAVGGGRS